MQPLTSPADFDALLEAPVALVYKHSTRCPISLLALDEVEALLQERPDTPVYVVDVVEQRPLSQHVAARTGVRHHSPQAILLVDGAPVWSASHFDVRADTMRRKLEAAAGRV